MFTGIIKSQAALSERRDSGKRVRLTFRLIGRNSSLKVGNSVAVDGTCLTVAAFRNHQFISDVIPETIRSTTLGRLRVGQRVNLERALRMGDEVGGHWVTGHVDGLGFIRKIEGEGTGFRLQIEAPPDIIRSLVVKGSIAVDGISFTLQEIRKRSFVVGVTPHTYRATTLQWKQAGDAVNLEVDLFAKLVRQFLSGARASPLTETELRRQGF